MTTATRTFIFWVDPATRFAALAKFGTDGPWGHMGVGFELSDKSEIYYEALLSEGFVGPKPIARLHRFVAEDDKRKLVVAYTDLDAATSVAKRHVCEGLTGWLGYNSLQLGLMAISERYHIPVPRSPGKVVCSEAVARVLQPEIDLRDGRRVRFDMVNPNSAWRRYLGIRAGYGWVNGPPAKV